MYQTFDGIYYQNIHNFNIKSNIIVQYRKRSTAQVVILDTEQCIKN